MYEHQYPWVRIPHEQDEVGIPDLLELRILIKDANTLQEPASQTVSRVSSANALCSYYSIQGPPPQTASWYCKNIKLGTNNVHSRQISWSCTRRTVKRPCAETRTRARPQSIFLHGPCEESRIRTDRRVCEGLYCC